MKALIQNKYIDFSTVTHIEETKNSLTLNMFLGDKITFYEDIDWKELPPKITVTKEEAVNFAWNNQDMTYLLNEDTVDFWETSDVSDFISLRWEKLKSEILKTWHETESAVKDIKVWNI